MSVQKRRQRPISDESEADSHIEKALKKDTGSRQRVRRVRRRIAYSPASSDSDSPVEAASKDIVWLQTNLKPKVYTFDPCNSGMTIEMKPRANALDYFQLFFSEQLVGFIVEKTNRYRAHKMDNYTCSFARPHERETTSSEIYSFLAIRLLMSRLKKLHRSEYWSKDKFLHTPIFGRIMSRDRYVFLFRMLYFTDVTTACSDRLAKITEFSNTLRLSFQNAFNPFGNLCIVEGLSLYKESLSFKRYIPSKRDGFGIDSCVLCDCKTGYVLNFLVEASIESAIKIATEKSFGKSGEIVATLIEPYLKKQHTLFVNHWYTSPALFDYLHDNETNACGTVKPRRRDMPKITKHLNAGEMSYRSSSNMLVLKWKDKRDVYMLSTCHHANFRIAKKNDARTRQFVRTPSCIVDYNENMAAVDNREKLITDLESVRKIFKWYKKCFFHLLDVSVWNAFCLFKMTKNGKYSMAEFHLQLIKDIIEKSMKFDENSNNRNNFTGDLSLRLIEPHFPTYCKTRRSDKTLRICVVCKRNDGRRRSRYQCEHCNVGLCVVPCFKIYHTDIY